jgi:hypothetical protein
MVNCQLYEQRDLKHSSALTCDSVEEIKKEHSSFNSVVQDTNNIKDVSSPTTRAVTELFSHTVSRCIQTAYRNMSTASRSRGKTCSSREFCLIFQLPFPSVCCRKTESRTVGRTFTDRTDSLLIEMFCKLSSSRIPFVFEI